MPKVRNPHWRFEPLGKVHNRNAFSCGNDLLDRYLKETARQDADRHIAAPFVLVDERSPEIILGYYTLSAFSIDFGELPREITRKLPRYPTLPATLLGRLAVDQAHQGIGLGEILIMDAFRRSYEQSSHVATYAIIVDAIDEEAVRFYQHFDFIRFPDRPSRLFLPLKTIAVLFT